MALVNTVMSNQWSLSSIMLTKNKLSTANKFFVANLLDHTWCHLNVLFVLKYGICVKKVGVEDLISSSRRLCCFKGCNLARLIHVRVGKTWEPTYFKMNLTFGFKIRPTLLKPWFLKLGKVFSWVGSTNNWREGDATLMPAHFGFRL